MLPLKSVFFRIRFLLMLTLEPKVRPPPYVLANRARLPLPKRAGLDGSKVSKLPDTVAPYPVLIVSALTATL